MVIEKLLPANFCIRQNCFEFLVRKQPCESSDSLVSIGNNLDSLSFFSFLFSINSFFFYLGKHFRLTL